MFGLQRTSEERSGDSTISLRSMSYNCPGHKARIKAISERVAAELRGYRVAVKIFDTLFRRAIQSLKAIPKISNKTEIRDELRLVRRKTLKDIKAVWI